MKNIEADPHKVKQKKCWIRAYEELNDFLPTNKRKIKFQHIFSGKVSVKDMIESIGIPHTEVDMILVNGLSVEFNYIVQNGDQISVYPEFESFDISGVQKLRPKPLRKPKFVLDVHLGTLAVYLRMLGFDSVWQNYLTDEQIVAISKKEKRAILTRDLGLLKRKEVTRGYWVRNTDPIKQTVEIIQRFDLTKLIKEFSRCLECNGKLKKIAKRKVYHRLPEKVKQNQNSFFVCDNCSKIYWHGTHYDKMKELIRKIKNQIGEN
ncbi:Mut7-C RNAse domain-containing protein [Melioribacteraceae bacterium 4301-Me]|uniref:Mut7-C RNAse domain-containing protein n=1 Tax=Pyranulibacter aquaticus TaxID=3163344 RepID=UPI003599DCA7